MPTSLEAVIILLTFLVPGYIAATVFTRNSPRAQVSDLRFILQVAVWSAVVHLVGIAGNAIAGKGSSLSSITESTRTLYTAATPGDVATAVLFLLVLPMVVGFAWRFLIDLDLAQSALDALGWSRSVRAPTAWDNTFRPGREGAWLYVYLRGQPNPIIGEYGIGSVAGVSPFAHDLFLKQRYEGQPDGPPRPVEMNKGIWISSDAIELVEFYSAEGGNVT